MICLPVKNNFAVGQIITFGGAVYNSQLAQRAIIVDFAKQNHSHSMVPVGLGVRSMRTRLMPSTSEVMRLTILCSTL